MKTNTARMRPLIHDQKQPAAQLSQDIARQIASSWLEIESMDTALLQGGTGILPWSASPAAQNAAAAAIADVIDARTNIVTSGFQPYGWMVAAGNAMADVACIHLGKKLPTRILTMTPEDISASFASAKDR